MRRLKSAWADARSDNSLCCAAQLVRKNSSFLHADREDSDQTKLNSMADLGVLVMHSHILGFLMSRQLCYISWLSNTLNIHTHRFSKL